MMRRKAEKHVRREAKKRRQAEEAKIVQSVPEPVEPEVELNGWGDPKKVIKAYKPGFSFGETSSFIKDFPHHFALAAAAKSH